MPSRPNSRLTPRFALLGRSLLGPFGAYGAWSVVAALVITALLTLFTQVGGLILWPFWAILTRFAKGLPKWRGRAFLTGSLTAIYLTVGLGLLPSVAKRTGRLRLPIWATDDIPTGPQNIGYALLFRNYVRTHTHAAYLDAVQKFRTEHPGVIVRYLDAGFPFPTLPLLPHLSHRDGQRVDVAFLFSRDGTYVDRTRSPIGYWGYATESPPRPECKGRTQKVGPFNLPLRWDFDGLQPHLPALQLDLPKNRALLRAFAKEPRVCSILLEPGLHPLMPAPKLIKNSCNVARHDDHFHLTIRARCG